MPASRATYTHPAVVGSLRVARAGGGAAGGDRSVENSTGVSRPAFTSGRTSARRLRNGSGAQPGMSIKVAVIRDGRTPSLGAKALGAAAGWRRRPVRKRKHSGAGLGTG
jgi:hypothetical protein